MKLSNFFKSIKIEENIYAVFNSLLMDIFFVDKEEYEKIIFLMSDNTVELCRAGIYVKDDEQDEKALQLLRKEYSILNRKVEILYFIVTTGCNLRCKYCFEENSQFNNHCEKNMSLETALVAAQKYLSYLENEDIESPQVIFYGGEPLANWQVVKNVVEFMASKNNKIKFNIVTNGTLINQDIANFIAKYDIEVGISLDGPKEINDVNRVFRTSEKSVYDSVMEKIKILKDEKVRYGLSITISENLLKRKEDVIGWIRSSKLSSVFYNLYHYGEKTNKWKELYNDMSDYLIESYDNVAYFGIADGRINRKVDSLLEQKFKFSDCAAVGANQLTVKPNGDVIICHGYVKTNKYILGNIIDQNISELINHPQSNMWVNNAPIYKDKCINCEAIYICGGGCSMQSETLFGGIENVDEAFCIHSKKSLIWLLKKLYKASIEQISEKGDNDNVEG